MNMNMSMNMNIDSSSSPSPRPGLGAKSIASLIEVCGGQPFDAWKVYRQTQAQAQDRRSAPGPRFLQLWRASGISSFHRVFFYMPSIYVTEGYIDNNIGKVLLIPLVVTPHVAFFENLKTQRQLGFGPKILKPQSFLSTYCRELFFISGMTIVVPELKKYGYNDVSSAIIAATLSQFASQPFDTIKTIQEHKQIGFMKALKGQTINSLWRGVTPRVLRGIWSFYCMNYIAQMINNQVILNWQERD